MIAFFKNNINILKNFGYLSVIQICNLLMPFMTYPYLVRTLGLELWGQVVLAQSVIFYFSSIISFGFDITATQRITIENDNEKISEIFSNVMYIKTILFLFSIIILILGLAIFISDKNIKALYIFTFLITINEWLFPTWFFQAIEKMKYITICNLISRILIVFFTFVLINSKSDFLMLPLLNAFGVFISSVIGLYFVFFIYKIKITRLNVNISLELLRESFSVFINRFVISIKDRFNIFFIAHFIGPTEVAAYDICLKILKLFSTFVSIISQSSFPKYSRTLSKKFGRSILKVSFVFNVILVLLCQWLFSYVIPLISNTSISKFEFPMRLIILAPIIFSIGNIMGTVLMNANRMYKIVFKITMYTVASYCILLFGGYLGGFMNNFNFFAFLVLITYTIEFVFRVLTCKKWNLI